MLDVIALGDDHDLVPVVQFEELREAGRSEDGRQEVKEDALLVVAGKVQNDEFSGGLRVMAEDLLDLVTLRTRYASLLRLSMNGQADASRLQQMLAPYRAGEDGGCRVLVQYENGKAVCEVALGDAWRVRPDERLIADLAAWLEPANVQVLYAA